MLFYGFVAHFLALKLLFALQGGMIGGSIAGGSSRRISLIQSGGGGGVGRESTTSVLGHSTPAHGGTANEDLENDSVDQATVTEAEVEDEILCKICLVDYR